MFCFDFVRWITLASRHLLTNCSVVKFFSAFLTSASSFALVLLICIFCIVLPFCVVNDGDMITCWRSPASVGLCFQILYPCVAPRPHCGTSITRSRICPCSFILPSGAILHRLPLGSSSFTTQEVSSVNMLRTKASAQCDKFAATVEIG